MSWHINETVNTVSFTKAQADKLTLTITEECPDHFYDGGTPFYEIRERGDGGWVGTGKFRAFFDPDHMEHMDWLTEETDILDLMAETGVTGDICFGSEEGDDAGSCWGVRFLDNGKWVHLKGEIQYVPVT